MGSLAHSLAQSSICLICLESKRTIGHFALSPKWIRQIEPKPTTSQTNWITEIENYFQSVHVCCVCCEKTLNWCVYSLIFMCVLSKLKWFHLIHSHKIAISMPIKSFFSLHCCLLLLLLLLIDFQSNMWCEYSIYYFLARDSHSSSKSIFFCWFFFVSKLYWNLLSICLPIELVLLPTFALSPCRFLLDCLRLEICFYLYIIIKIAIVSVTLS